MRKRNCDGRRIVANSNKKNTFNNLSSFKMKTNPFKIQFVLFFLLLAVLTTSCNSKSGKTASIETDQNGVAILTDDQIENIVKRSYQYVAMYNVNNKFALKQGGWNTLDADTKLKDHTMREIARPNNDSFYASALLDLRAEPVIMYLPAFDSKYVSLMVTAYDHYVDVPKATRNGRFSKTGKNLCFIPTGPKDTTEKRCPVWI